jgi:predicted nucleic acid-binding protein
VALSAPRYLADRSALALLRLPAVAARLQPLLDERAVATCSVVDLELLYSARNAAEHRQRRTNLIRTFPLAPIDQAVIERSVEVQGLHADIGAHRAASVPDVIIAAAAEARD